MDPDFVKMWNANLGFDMNVLREDHQSAVARARDSIAFDNRLINAVTTREILTGDDFQESMLKTNASTFAPYPVSRSDAGSVQATK